MKKFGKILGRLLIGVVVIALLLTAGGAFYFKSYLPNTVAPKSSPQIDGEIKIEGLDGPVDIYRDQMGIPHIYATTSHDLFFAQGYVHAQDRFWQMDFWRHVGSARLSEMFGEGQVETDAFLRTLGWRQVAEQEYEGLNAELKSTLSAYAEGVNAYLKDHSGAALSLEYAILGLLSPDYKIEPWEPVNTLTWAKAMAWDLRGNMGEEIERAVLLKTLTPEQVDELFPPYPSDHPVIVPQIGEGTAFERSNVRTFERFDVPSEALAVLEHNVSLTDAALGPAGDGIGSNSWAVAGSRTASGMPLLANDMHLSIQMPSIWYQNALHCRPKNAQCPYETTGFTFAGVPGVVAGHNDHIAWGYTNLSPDVMDLYIEKVNPENPNQYEVNGGWVDFETRQETIRVAGGEPVIVTVRSTRHGPVISDTYGPLKDKVDPKDKEAKPFKEKAGIDLPENYVIALKWAALNPGNALVAIWGFNRAENWEQFGEAARYFIVPAQNLLYADTEGNIGYQTPGLIPIRKNGDGRFPVPGWTDDYEWSGYIPFEELPYAFNPSSGYIVTANNQAPPRDYPYLITADWNYGFRANRIVEMIENAPGKIDIAYFQQIHGDSYDANAAVFVPLFAQAIKEMGPHTDEPNLEAAYNLLQNWDYQARADSAAAAVFEAFWRQLLLNTFTDELPKDYWPEGSSRWSEVMQTMASEPNNSWWDDKQTQDRVETRDDMIVKSFDQAVADLESLLGKDPLKWQWGDLHTATFRNTTLGESGIGPIEALFNRGPFHSGGGEDIVNATGWDALEGYEVTWLPSEREIVDLGNLTNSVAIHTTGQSGHAYHPHYIDMAPLWASVQYYPMLWDEQAVIENAEGHLRLTP